MSLGKWWLVVVLLPFMPAVADAQAVQLFGGIGGGVASVPRGGDSLCGGIAQRLTGLSGELRAGLRSERLEFAVRAARIIAGSRTVADCAIPPDGIHTHREYEYLDGAATTFDASVWYAAGRILLGAEAGVVPSHSSYVGAGAAVGVMRNRVRLEATARMYRVPFVAVTREWQDARIIREVSRTDETEVLPGFTGRVVLIWP